MIGDLLCSSGLLPLFARWPQNPSRPTTPHTEKNELVVVGPMLLELLSAFVVLSKAEEGTPQILSAIGLTLLMLIWGSTFLSQVPAHNHWVRGYSRNGRNLVKSNWTRTVLWSRLLCSLGHIPGLRRFEPFTGAQCFQTVPSPSGAPRLRRPVHPPRQARHKIVNGSQ